MGTIYVDGQFKRSAIPVKVVKGSMGSSDLTNYVTKEELYLAILEQIDQLIDGAPETLDTLREIYEYLEGDAGALVNKLNQKVDKVEGKGLSTNDFTDADFAKLQGIQSGAEENVQSDWSETDVTSDAFIKNKPTLGTLAFKDAITKAEIGLGNVDNTADADKPISTAVLEALDGKIDLVQGKGLSTEDYTTAEKTKLGNIENGANNYVHPTTPGNKHIPAGGSKGLILTWLSDGAAQWQDSQIEELLQKQAEMDSKLAQLMINMDLYSYGVEWDTTVSSPLLTRIGNPLLHKSLPIQSAFRGCVANGSEINYYLYSEDWAYKEDGETPSVLDGSDGTVRVHIPRFYGKSGREVNKKWVRISTVKIDDSWTEIPEMLIDAYRCTVDTTNSSAPKAVSVVNTSTAFRGGGNRAAYDSYLTTELDTKDVFRSDLGKPRTGLSRATMRTYALNAGSELMCYEYYKWIFYWCYVIEYANFNSQAAYNEELTSDGYRLGGLGAGVTNMSLWEQYNGNYPLTPCGFGNGIGNHTDCESIPSLTYDYTTAQTTDITAYTKDSTAATMTNGTGSITISEVLKANTRYLYRTWNNQTGETIYNIAGLLEGLTIEFFTGSTVVATADSDGLITVDWPSSSLSDRALRSLFVGECNITITLVSASSVDVTLTRPILSVPRWRGFDNPFGDIWTNLEGIVILRTEANEISSVYTTTDIEEFTDIIGGKTIAGYEIAQDGYIKEFDLGETAEIIPSEVGGSSITYKCDYHYCNPGSTSLSTLLVGGCASTGCSAGLGYFYSSYSVGSAAAFVGFRTLTRV